MKVYLASDHAGFELKEALCVFLSERGIEIEDIGPHTLDPLDDYPDYMFTLGTRVLGDAGATGIGIGASGQGEGMALNRIKGIRAAVFYGGNEEVLKLSRAHNNANVLSLGARFISIEDAKKAVEVWLAEPFSQDERHMRRIAKLD